MVPNQYSLTWDSYKSSICGGFSTLQQNGEFVDMTLAADGHLVKVHQVLIALASPYLKELLSSVPAQHPVIFLNNVSHTTLGLLLEYIYTGEVLVPARHLQSFMESAKALHIRGLENVNSNDCTNMKVVSTPDSASMTQQKRGLPIDIHSVQTTYDLPTSARKISFKPESHITSLIHMKDESNKVVKNDYHSYSETAMDAAADNASDDDHDSFQISNISNETHHENDKTDDRNNRIMDMDISHQTGTQEKVSNNQLQFTVSIRGSLQVILNRYMYGLQSTQASGVRRWRCIDYRNNKCPAALVTKGNVVLSRVCLHSHSFHDKKILSKIEKNAVYSALDEVVGYKEKESRNSEEEWQTNSSGFVSLPSLDCDSEVSNSKSK